MSLEERQFSNSCDMATILRHLTLMKRPGPIGNCASVNINKLTHAPRLPTYQSAAECVHGIQSENFDPLRIVVEDADKTLLLSSRFYCPDSFVVFY